MSTESSARRLSGPSDTRAVRQRVARRLAVLIVDKDDVYVEFIRHLFTRYQNLQFELTHVRRLADVLPTLASGRFGVVLLNVHLPDGNGLEWLRASAGRVQAAVIVLGDAQDFDPTKGVSPRADEFLLKSQVTPDQLIRAVHYAIDRHQARQRLVRSRAYFQSLIEQARDLITVIDDQGVIAYQSPASRHILGQPPDAFTNRSLFEFIVDTDVERARNMLTAVLSGHKAGASGEFDFRFGNGSTRTLDIVASRIRSTSGSRRVVLNSRDVTERRQATEALRFRDQQLRQAQKMEAVGRLAGGIAHDFSTVLTVITTVTERLQDRVGADRDAAADLDVILRNCARAAALTRQLLAFSRQQTLAPRPLDLGHLVRKTGRLLKRLIGEHIELAIDVSDDGLAIEADPTQLEQVLMNLAINARDAMSEGGTLRLALTRLIADEEFAREHAPMTPGEYVRLEVSDTGSGMTPETMARAFEPFFTTKHPAHGTGLGLSTVYGIIKQSGGYIWLDSELGSGTTFRIYLPPTTATPVEDAPPRPRPTGHLPATILLVEDEDDVRGLVRDLLIDQGYTVLEAAAPSHAVQASADYDRRIDLLLTDVVMPGGTGRELARQLSVSRPGIKVLYMSGYPEHGAPPGSVLEAGVPFLQKPFTRDRLLEKLNELLG